MTDFSKLLAKYPPKHGERTARVIERNAITPALEPSTGSTDWEKQDSLHHMIGKPNQTLSDPIPVRGVTQVQEEEARKGEVVNEDWDAVRRDWERSVYEQADRDDDRAAMNIDPNPPGVTIRAFTAAEITALDAPFETDPACGACGRITIDDLFHDCDLAPAGMATIQARLELVPYVVVDRIGFYWGSTSSRSIATKVAASIRGRAITTVFGEIVEVTE